MLDGTSPATLLADVARALNMRIIGTEQNPKGLGPNEEVVRQRCDVTLSKMHFDACADGLLDLLVAPGGATVTDVVVAGCEAHVCLLQTALGLLRAGMKVWVVEPASGSRSAENLGLAMHRLQQAGAVIVSVEMVAFEWLRSCKHEKFRDVLNLLRQRAG